MRMSRPPYVVSANWMSSRTACSSPTSARKKAARPPFASTSRMVSRPPASLISLTTTETPSAPGAAPRPVLIHRRPRRSQWLPCQQVARAPFLLEAVTVHRVSAARHRYSISCRACVSSSTGITFTCTVARPPAARSTLFPRGAITWSTRGFCLRAVQAAALASA